MAFRCSRDLRDGLAGDRLIKVRGILNGTCNYILTRIEQAGTSFAEALGEAQRAGFAEADPTDDIDGLDAGAKLVILARVGLNLELRPEQVVCRSIQDVSGPRLRIRARPGLHHTADFHRKHKRRESPRCRRTFACAEGSLRWRKFRAARTWS